MRGNRMWEFFDRLLAVSIPRIRDFRGLNPRSFDGRGNYSFGVTEQLIFPEIDFDRVSTVKGMDITICTSATDDSACQSAARCLRFPVPQARAFDEKRLGVSCGKEINSPQGQPQAQVHGAGLYPLPALRPGPGLSARLRHVPYLRSSARCSWRTPRSQKGVLVGC